jgi:hypothetical protein
MDITKILADHAEWLSDNTKGKRANLTEANLAEANLTRVNLTNADLIGADLTWTNLEGANLTRADLSDADLTNANLTGVNLGGANLYGANLTEATGIVSFGPVGYRKRIGLAVKHDDTVYVQLGCFWGTQDEAVKAIRAKYGEKSIYERFSLVACEVVLNQ